MLSGYASVFNVKDLGGDIVLPGSFKRCLRRRKDANRPFPILFSHDQQRPIGKVLEAREDSTGLFFKGMIDASIPDGQHAISGIKQGYLSSASIGYQVLDHDFDRNGARLLKEIELYEISPVALPMNPGARITVE